MSILLFLLEFVTVISILYYIAGATFTKNPIRIVLSGLLFIGRLISVTAAAPTYPNTFIILPIILLLFNEAASYKICWLAVCTLSEGMIAYFISNIYFILTNTTGYTTTHHNLLTMLDCIIFTAFILCSFGLRRKRKERSQILHNINNRSYILIIIASISAFVLLNISELIFMNSLNTLGRYVMTFILHFFIIALMITVIAFISTQYRNILLQEKDAMNQRFLAIERKHYLELEQKNTDLRAFRHDFNSHILTLNNLLIEKDLERITQYLQNLTIIQSQNNYISTGNIIADATINRFYDILCNDVLFKVSGYFPENCFVTDFDLCTIISNLMKNASEAVEKATSVENKAIYLNIDASESRILILLKNTSLEYNSSQLANLQTNKADKKNHGYGLSNIQQITDKYHGFMQVDFQNPFFITHIILNKSFC